MAEEDGRSVRSTAALRRLDELRDRGIELSDRLARFRTGQSSRPEDLMAAAAAGERSAACARDAEDHRRTALHNSAGAHDRAAAAHDRAARSGSGDAGDHADQATRHRAAAVVDRDAAAAPDRPTAVADPPGGTGPPGSA